MSNFSPTRVQVVILLHTRERAAGGLYCGSGPELEQLVAEGLMELVGFKSFVPDGYYRLTTKGRHALLNATSGKVSDRRNVA